MKIFFILIISLIVTGCYDPILKANITNKVGKEIEILQYNAPKYYYVVLQDNKSRG